MEDDMNDPMTDLLAHSLEGNALGVKDAINDLLAARAMDAIQSMKIDVAQSIYGTTTGEDDLETEMELPADEAEADDFIDSTADDLFAELDQLVDSEDEYSEEESEEQDED